MFFSVLSPSFSLFISSSSCRLYSFSLNHAFLLLCRHIFRFLSHSCSYIVPHYCIIYVFVPLFHSHRGLSYAALCSVSQSGHLHAYIHLNIPSSSPSFGPLCTTSHKAGFLASLSTDLFCFAMFLRNTPLYAHHHKAGFSLLLK